MTDCFWTDFVKTTDPSCFEVIGVFAQPLRQRNVADPSVDFLLYSDDALTLPLSPTVATITHITGYDNSGGSFAACDYDAWIIAGPPYVSPPIAPGTLIANSALSISFDPTGPIPLGSISGITHDLSGVYLNGYITFVAVLHIVTDVGECDLLIGSDYCF